MDESPVALFIDHSKRSINDIGTPNDIEGNLADKRKPSENSPFSVGAPPENGKKSALVSVPECLTWNDPAAQAPYTDTYVSTVQSSSHLSLTCSAGDTLTIASHMTTDLIKNKKSVRYCHIIVPRQIILFHFNSLFKKITNSNIFCSFCNGQISKKCVTAELIGKDDHKEVSILFVEHLYT
ncbi:unnamed protein product [Adineta steineri]|uniref:Uncharacterized protein n=1 Tax=Adineta steineri TaxID=433720 RepID=A0A819XF92_9BILA|nr:unnamed protein product [Adineta steineri]